MIDFEKKIAINDLIKVFNNRDDRSVFISDYIYFNKDNNHAFYSKFISENISKSGNVQEDAIELSIATNQFETKYIECIKSIIRSKRKWWIKLLCLDWTLCFVNELSKQVFTEISEYLIKSRNDLLKVQSLLNMLTISNMDEDLNEQLLTLLKKNKDPAVFYRLANWLNNSTVLKIELHKIITIIHQNTYLSDKQKSELTKMMQR